ncbi:MazG nucleotide pyrophosphohydrolase domain-containing protein [Arthrobacter sp. LAPM80]|uniref:MazG nucleotide pyrophosphohydrolase domain-containing protein n=1 Tax=Arthrobacter sp. LAPM80 TaxID=3141788 RepID=UPI00398AEBAF
MTTDTPHENDRPAISTSVETTEVEMARLVGVVAALREHCPWTAALTHDSLTTYLLEESYEFIEAIEGGHTREVANELGDILLQVVLHARLAQEQGGFDLAEVARGISSKMIRRSPHVFHSDGTLRDSFPATIAEIEETWERVKAAERAAADAAGDATGTVRPVPGDNPFAGIPGTLPALAMAQKTVERAARAGLDLPVSTGGPPGHSHTEAELGKVLLDVVLDAQKRGLNAERALRAAVREFQGRTDR